jgi:hypothetical protein
MDVIATAEHLSLTYRRYLRSLLPVRDPKLARAVGAENLCHLGRSLRNAAGSVKRPAWAGPVLARPEMG